MTILDKSQPIGMVVNRTGSDAEAAELVSTFTAAARPALDILMEHLLRATADADGDSLSLWLVTLRGLCLDLERLLTERKVGVQPDVVQN